MPADASILCGAGISVGSGLPDGQELAAEAFRHVVRGNRVFDSTATAEVLKKLAWSSTEPALRLELLLEIMGRDIPVEVLAGVYSMVLTAAPSFPHFVLAASARPLITTNQDALIEAASAQLGSAVKPLHLHGIASAPETIMTTLSQYSAGLPSPIKETFHRNLVDRHLIVLGYSGRDLDVMPMLRLARHITWLHYQAAGAPAAFGAELQRLRRDMGRRLHVVATDNPAGWLAARLPLSAQHAAADAAAAAGHSSPVAIDDRARAAFDAVAAIDKRLAIARILMHTGQPQAALAGLRSTGRAAPRSARVKLRTAEALAMLADNRGALRHYHLAAKQTTEPDRQASALLGSASVLANTGRYTAALADLVSAEQAAHAVKDAARRRNIIGKINDSAARIHTMTGDDAAALKAYRSALAAARATHDVDLTLRTLTFSSDVYRSQGNFNQALRNLDEAFADNEIYGRPFTRGWASYYRGLARCASGDLVRGLPDLDRSRDEGAQTGNYQMHSWALLTLSSYLLVTDLTASANLAAECADVLASHQTLRLCRIRLEWHLAELARAHKQHDEALDRVASLRGQLARRGPVPHYVEPYLEATEAEVARERGDPRATALLQTTRQLFRTGGWRHAVTRMDVSLWLLGSRGPAPARLLARCKRENYGLELQRLVTGDRDRYPLHIT